MKKSKIRFTYKSKSKIKITGSLEISDSESEESSKNKRSTGWNIENGRKVEENYINAQLFQNSRLEGILGLSKYVHVWSMYIIYDNTDDEFS